MYNSRDFKAIRWPWMECTPFLSGWLLLFILAHTDYPHANESERTQPPSPINEASLEDWKQKKNEGWACYNLGRAYHLGTHGVKQDPAKAVSFYEIGAKANYAKAQSNLGYCYATGFGVEKNAQKAAQWYRLAAAQGDRFAQMNHASHLVKEAFKTENQDMLLEAMDWYLKAHYQDETLTGAAYGIGLIYSKLEPTDPQNTNLAKRWFGLAAADEHPDAQFAMGYIEEGLGNGKEAYNWYKLAKAKGSHSALFNLGRCYENGFGIAQNIKLAEENYRMAALGGHPESQYALGLLIYNDSSSEVDFREVFMWWNLAKKNGLSSADEALRKLESSRLISSEGMAAARDAAANFTPKRFQPKQIPSFNRDVALSSAERQTHAEAGFFVSRDGWLITSPKALSIDQQTRKLETGYGIKIITEAGTFPITDSIYIHPDENIAALKISGEFHPLPLLDNDGPVKETSMFAISLDSPKNDHFSPRTLKGEVEKATNSLGEPVYTLNTAEIPNSMSNFLLFNTLGHVTGFASTVEKRGAKKLDAVKSSEIYKFIKSSIPEIKLETNKTEGQPSEVALIDRARQATAMVVVYRK